MNYRTMSYLLGKWTPREKMFFKSDSGVVTSILHDRRTLYNRLHVFDKEAEKQDNAWTLANFNSKDLLDCFVYIEHGKLKQVMSMIRTTQGSLECLLDRANLYLQQKTA